MEWLVIAIVILLSFVSVFVVFKYGKKQGAKEAVHDIAEAVRERKDEVIENAKEIDKAELSDDDIISALTNRVRSDGSS